MPEVKVIQANSLDWICNLEDESVNLILTDPPYWTLEKWRNVGTTTRLGGNRDKSKQDKDKWFDTISQDDLWGVINDFGRILKKNSHCYIFCDHEVMPIILMWIREGETVFNYSKPLVWDKMSPGLGYHYRARHEYIVMLEKGKRRLNNLSIPDVLQYKRIAGNHYPTEKPLELIETLLLNSTQEGELVLDPFCGSGVVGEACKKHGRSAILIDNSPKAIEVTQQRLESCNQKSFLEIG